METLTSLPASIAVPACFALFALAFAERLIPFLPSSLLLAAVGAGAATGAWSLQAALAVSTAGGLLGALLLYGLGAWSGEARIMRVLSLLLVPSALAVRLKNELVSNAGAFTFGMQLIPTARLVAPALSGMLRARVLTFAATCAPGILLWNATFIFLGYAAANGIVGETQVTLAGTAVLLCLVLIQLVAFRAMRRQPKPVPGSRRCDAPPRRNIS